MFSIYTDLLCCPDSPFGQDNWCRGCFPDTTGNVRETQRKKNWKIFENIIKKIHPFFKIKKSGAPAPLNPCLDFQLLFMVLLKGGALRGCAFRPVCIIVRVV